MKNVQSAATTISALFLAGCTTLVAPDEVKSLTEATTSLSGALSVADSEQVAALSSLKREEYRIAMAMGAKSRLSTECLAKIDAANEAFEQQLDLPYSSVASDATFRTLRAIAPCGLPDIELSLSPLPAPDPVDLDRAPISSVGQSSLSKAARQLNAYTEALADIATGESSGKVDSAQAQVVASAKGLLGALKVGGPADAIIDVTSQTISSLVAAKRNRTTREFLDRMDRAMPFMMERLGAGARLAVLQAATNRARAVHSLSEYGNRSLNASGMIVTRGRERRASAERMALYDDLAARLTAHNQAFLALRQSDPMIAARDFADTHRALREIYNDPRANRASLAKSLADFTESATALAVALKGAESAN